MSAEKIKKPPTNLFPSDEASKHNRSDLRILIVHAEWNKAIIDSLLQGSISTLESLDVKRENILIHSVPGSYELPWACNAILTNPVGRRFDAIIAIGVLIKGDTMHFEYIADAVTKQLMQISVNHNKPIIFGVLTCLNETQARIRSGLDSSSPSNHNHAIDWAKAAIRIALDCRRFKDESHLADLFKTVDEIIF